MGRITSGLRHVLGVSVVAVAMSGCPDPLPDLETETASSGMSTSETGDSLGSTTDAVDGTTTTTTTTTLDSTTGDATCGNGIVETGEACDDEGESATCDADCTPAECGDETINSAAGEACEGEDLAGETCLSQGFDGGTLACGGCALDTSHCQFLPSAPVLALGFSQVKRFDFSWAAVDGAELYQLLESTAPGEPFVQVGEDVVAEMLSLEMPLHLRWEASYVLRACNEVGCTDSAAVDVVGSLAEAVGYVKASNTGADDMFGYSVALSGDGSTLAVGAYGEDSSATGVDGNQASSGASSSGAVYVYTRDGLGAWSQQAYVKASNTGAGDQFGWSVALSGDGSTLAVGAYGEDSSATGIGGNQADNSAAGSGAAYVYTRDAMGAWSQQAYVKASNTGAGDYFGHSVALSGGGSTLAVGAIYEASSATGIGGNQADNSAPGSGAAYVYTRDAMGAWSQQAYVKASNTGEGDIFGWSVALSGDGSTLAVGALYEESSATGIGGNQADDSASGSGAVYMLTHDGLGAWSQQAYVKASNTGEGDQFGWKVALSDDGSTLAVGAYGEASSAPGIGGDQADDSATQAGAVYVLTRDGPGEWSQQAYVKASSTREYDHFGWDVALSADGGTLAVGANLEDSNATGIDGNQADDSTSDSGAVYVYTRDEMGAWSQQAYVKAPNTGQYDHFGYSVALAGDGSTLATGANREDSNATGLSGNQRDDSATNAGAVYLY